MNRPVTKYLLFIPFSYLSYCFLQDRREQLAREELINRRDPDNIFGFQYSRFKKCKTTPELANILKKTVKHVRMFLTEPQNRSPELVDCEVIDSGEGVGSWLSYPYHTKTSLRVNKFNFMDNQKSGSYSLLFWSGVRTKEQLRLSDIENSEEIVKQIVKKREEKCFEIAKHSSPTSNIEYERSFTECIRKSEGGVRLLEKELERIGLVKNYKMIS